MNILVTGAAGFIGFHVSKRLLEDGYRVVGFDNVNDYYDVKLKHSRLEILHQYDHFTFYKNDVADKPSVEKVFSSEHPQRVIHLAAQAGVRRSLNEPEVYLQSNITGFLNILEACRHHKTEHLVYASSSSVYGLNTNYPFSVKDNVDHPISFYAASKKSNELMAHAYSYLFQLPTTGLRFFSVYGPWGRPDMAMFKFTQSILEGKPIDIYNRGEMVRDFTYIDDIVEGVKRVLLKIPDPDPNWSGDNPDPASSLAPYRLYNIGSNAPIKLMDFVTEIEKNLGIPAQLNLMPMQPGDIPKSHADVENLIEEFDYAPKHGIQQGIKIFIDWFVDYYQIKLSPSHRKSSSFS